MSAVGAEDTGSTGKSDDADRAARPDATSVAAMVSLCTYTWFLYGIGPSLPLLRDELGTTSAVAGLHSLMLAGGVIIAGFTGVNLGRRWRRYGVAWRGIVVLTIGVLIFTAGSLLRGVELAVTLPAMLVIGFAGGLLINVSNTILQEHNGALGPAMLTLGNAAAAGVGLVTPLAVGLATDLGWTWRAAMILVLPFAVISLILIRPRRQVPAYALRPAGSSRFSFRGLPQAYWFAATAVVSAVAIEFCMITWTPDLLTSRTGMTPGTASGACPRWWAEWPWAGWWWARSLAPDHRSDCS